MKVLSKKDWDAFRIECSCAKCEAKLEVEQKDIQHTPASGHQLDHDPERFYVTCAVCHNIIDIAADRIPLFLQDKARTRSTNDRCYSWQDR